MKLDKKTVIKKAAYIMCMVGVNVSLCAHPVLANSGVEIVTTGLDALLEIIKAFISSVGALVVLWGIFEWGNSMQGNDGIMQASSFKRIGGGLVMTVGPQLLGILVG